MDDLKVGAFDGRTRGHIDILRIGEVFEPLPFDFNRCNDPHKIGCRELVDIPIANMGQSCKACIWRNF